MRFDLQPGVARCFAENMKNYLMTFGNYSIVNPKENQTLTVRVTSQGGTASHHLAEHVQSGQFSFVAHESGDFLACIWGDETHDPQVLSIDFEWKTGVNAKDWPKIAKKSNIDRMALEVQILHETALSIKDEMSYLLQRNTEMLEVNWRTDSGMLLFIFVSFFVTFIVAGLQLWNLKSFFKKNKIL
ncbi:emp24/gp25L/p24 family protein [Medicago truncatula]|nr:emp24/gp25L/p24 family protein [Medicago truncatula]